MQSIHLHLYLITDKKKLQILHLIWLKVLFFFQHIVCNQKHNTDIVYITKSRELCKVLKYDILYSKVDH